MSVMPIHGREGIKYLFEQALNNKEKILRSALSDKPLVYLAGENFAETYMNKRREAGIFLKSLRFSSADVDLPQHKSYASYNKAVRVAPKEIILKDSVILWDDYVAIVDSRDISGTIVHDEKYAAIMKQWFDFIWEQSFE